MPEQKNTVATVATGSPDVSAAYSCKLIAAGLIAFLCITHFLVIATFSFHLRISGLLAPAALLLSLAGGYILAGNEGVSVKGKLSVTLITLFLVALSLILANAFYDMSWDGLWYHQAAVYQMSHGWNPIADPMHYFTPDSDNQMWMRHYAKGAWYIALALYQTTGNIEMAKAAPWMALAATFLMALSIGLDAGLKKKTAALIAALTACNPIVMFELPSYLVDGLMISFLVIYLLSLYQLSKKIDALTIMLMTGSGILAINAKFTGFVYLCVFSFAALIYFFFRQKAFMWNYLKLGVLMAVLALCIWGYNPYITNTVFRGNPFYPMMGSKAFPSLVDQGEDPIEKWETPHNMQGKNRFVRLGYAIFGRPGAQPYYVGENASLMVPFAVSWNDFSIYYFHDVRISGFGPLFSGVFVLSLALLVWAALRRRGKLLLPVLLLLSIVFSLLLSVHTWWARYGPQLWWTPLIVIAYILVASDSLWMRRYAYLLAAILCINVVLVTGVHFTWEAGATRMTNEQLSMLRGKKNIQADMQYFVEPFGERFKNAGVQFQPVKHIEKAKQMEVISVSPGYPCAVRVGYDE